jgi:amino acid transporter
MELDELKKSWQQAPGKNFDDTNIMGMVRSEGKGPLQALRKAYMKQIVVLIVVPVALLLTNIDYLSAAFSSILFWTYILFCIGMMAFAFYNLRIVMSLQHSHEMLSTHLRRKLELLEKRKKAELIFMRATLLLLIILTEITPYFQQYRMLDKWHALSPAIRFPVYVLMIVLQYFASRNLKRKRTGEHIDHLRKLVGQLD